ncbi:2Fe-2S iron-sulfur cluster-binding protein [Streptomyces sp. YIM B13518]|uniref:2Fe-2S iron-sulfur cluster-binding protein n=1 Tax=Streptomyces sp. YIM B13518 TaxID=3366316 RepID=UPI00369B846F
MTDDQHGQGTPPGGSRWDPLPQGDYDDGATAFVNLPEGGIDALLDSMQSPLAAPGHGYVPPQITVDPTAGAGADPAATGSWGVPGAPIDGAQWHDPEAGAAPGDRFTYDPGATGQWAYGEGAAGHPAPGHDVTGQWSIPVADGDLPDESGEFTASSLVEQWGGTPPATLPGGAPAPWAPPQDIGRPWGPGVPGVPQDEGQEPRGGEHNPQQQPPGADAYGGQPLPYAEPAHQDAYGGTPAHGTPVRPAGERAPGRPDADFASEHAPGRSGSDSVPGQEAYGGTPAHGTPVQPAGERAPEWPDADFASEHAPGRSGSDSVSGQEAYGGTPAHGTPVRPAGERASEWPDADFAPEQPSDAAGHAGTPSAGVPQPFAAEGHAEPRWQPEAETAEDAPAAPPEHPHPDGQDAPEPVSEAADAPADAHGAPEAAEGPLEPSEAPVEPAPDAEPATGPAAGPPDTDPAPDAPDSPDGPDGPDGRGEPGAEPATGPAAGPPDTDPAPDAPDSPDAPDGRGEPGAAHGADDAPPPHDDHPLASYALRVNGTDRPVTDAWIGESLLYVLRERLGLAGAKDGCSQGECGACNVQVDGRLVASCLVPAVTAAGSEVRTVEGLAQDGRPSDVQRALARCGAVQCGFCVPGMAMTVHDLLEGNPAPTELETRQALCGNLCRCSGYRGVVNAVKEVVAEREAHAASDGDDSDGEADPPRIPHQAGPGAGGVNPAAFGAPGPDEQSHDQPHGPDGGQA